jgi:hypothetical protein
MIEIKIFAIVTLALMVIAFGLMVYRIGRKDEENEWIAKENEWYTAKRRWRRIDL